MVTSARIHQTRLLEIILIILDIRLHSFIHFSIVEPK